MKTLILFTMTVAVTTAIWTIPLFMLAAQITSDVPK